MEIKKLTDLPIGELGEENYVVADVDGAVKRIPAEDIGGGGGMPDPSELPDGTYTLKCTIVDGAPAYSWEVDS